jgi:hypothetical protein
MLPLTLSCKAHVAVCNILAITFSENSSSKVELNGDNVASLCREKSSLVETEVSLLAVLEMELVARVGLSASDSLEKDPVAEGIFADCR